MFEGRGTALWRHHVSKLIASMMTTLPWRKYSISDNLTKKNVTKNKKKSKTKIGNKQMCPVLNHYGPLLFFG